MRKSTQIQSILFDRNKWSIASARHWLTTHSKKAPKADTTENFYRFRQSPPFQFVAKSFRTISLSARQGIKAVIGIPRKAGKVSTKKNPAKTIKTTVRKSPRLPTILVDIATAISIDLEGGQELKFPLRGDFALCSNRRGNELWIVSRKHSKKIDTTDTDPKAEKLYESFTGFEHSPVGKLIHAKLQTFTRIGRAMSIVYRSDKFSRPGRTSDYVHSFKHYPSISVDNPKRPTIVALRGGQIKVKKEGITG